MSSCYSTVYWKDDLSPLYCSSVKEQRPRLCASASGLSGLLFSWSVCCIPSPKPHCLNYSSFIGSLEPGLLLFQYHTENLGSFPRHVNFRISLLKSKNNTLGFWVDCVGSIDQEVRRTDILRLLRHPSMITEYFCICFSSYIYVIRLCSFSQIYFAYILLHLSISRGGV
jgi:hypothetical protein